MHIELTEMLRCPADHREEYLVLSTAEMSGRRVRRGLVGCPVCHREYEIADGVVHFEGAGGGEPGAGADLATPAPGSPLPAPDILQALLDLSGPGGVVVLLGSAARSTAGLAELLGGIHLVAVNPPADLAALPVCTQLRATAAIPLRSAVARGVVVGAELAVPAWLGEARRVLLRGRRLVIEREAVAVPGVTPLAVGRGLWVGANP